jgi:2-C-methyl-D-erythritol 4-phosphate cytidylyltransferase
LPRDVGVILVAAGQGTRVGGAPKQFRQLAGVPIVLRALRPFTAHREVAQVVLVLPPADAGEPPPFLRGLAGPALRLVPGGAERGDSVLAGLGALEPVCSIVLVHDAARPFVKADVIDAVIQEARAGSGAVAAVPITDTVKELAGGGHRVLRTLPRERLWRAQTPQGFPRALLAEAYERARQDGVKATDDAALVERLGATVTVVPDSPRNFKITTAEDLAWAEAWVASRG